MSTIGTLQASLWAAGSATDPLFKPSYTVSTDSYIQTLRLRDRQNTSLIRHWPPESFQELVTQYWPSNWSSPVLNEGGTIKLLCSFCTLYVESLGVMKVILWVFCLVPLDIYRPDQFETEDHWKNNRRYCEEPRTLVSRMVIQLCPNSSFLWPLVSVYAHRSNTDDQSGCVWLWKSMQRRWHQMLCFASESHLFCILMML